MEAAAKSGRGGRGFFKISKTSSATRNLRRGGSLWRWNILLLGNLTLPGLPWRAEGKQKGNYSCPPLLGEHNDYVFGNYWDYLMKR